MRFFGLFVLVGGLVSLTGGCGSGDGGALAPVSGTVTMDGKPLADATVTFDPVKTRVQWAASSEGKTDENGRYSLTLLTRPKKGAVIGRHRVSVSGLVEVADATGKPTYTEKVPMKYNASTTLYFDVQPGGTNKADFALTSK